MKLRSFLFFTVALMSAGCGIAEQSATPTSTARASTSASSSPLSSKEWITAALRRKAAEKKVFWQVWCTSAESEEYSAIATTKKPFNIYAEDGAEWYWATHNHRSPEDAAYALLQMLDGEPNRPPIELSKTTAKECTFEPWTGAPSKSK